MTFAIFTSYDKPYKKVADITVPIMAEYCDRWGYEFQVRQNPVYPNGIIWGRINDFMAYDGSAEWMVHLDADVLITNLKSKLEMVIEDFAHTPFKPIIITGEDHNGINDGFLACKNPSRSTLNALWEPKKYDCFQTALTANVRGLVGVWAPVHQRLVNSYHPGEYPGQDPKGQWEHGDFILHLPGRSNERRVELLNEYLPKIIR